MSTDHEDSLAEPQEAGNEGSADSVGRTLGGALNILLPPDRAIWNEARRLAADKNIRVEDLATCASQDPVIVLDLLKIANAMYFSGGRSPITATKTAIVRLGYDVVVETLEKMSERVGFEDEDVTHWFEEHRARCKRAAIVARILAEALIRALSDDCQAAGLMLYVGDMLAVAHLQSEYVRLAEELSKSAINYRLTQDFKFDTEKMGLAYLRRYGIPEALLFAIDREARTRSQERAIMKPLCMAAGEMVDAFDANRWEKLAPGKSLAPKSNIRMLQIPDVQYLKIYERCSEYLFSLRLEEEKKKHQAVASISEVAPAAIDLDTQIIGDASLEDDIQELLKHKDEPDEEPIAGEKPKSITVPQKGSVLSEQRDREQFSLDKPHTPSPSRVQNSRPIEMPKTSIAAGQQVLENLSGLFSQAQTSEQLLADLLAMLVDRGPFKKTALIVVSKDRKKAVVVAARGLNIGNGQTLIIDDPLSPLAQCFSKIQSFGTRENKNSPFGSQAYALAAIDADHDTPVALYADCGNNGSVTFEARRIFRTVVEALNQRLVQIPGGIPVEI